MAGVVAMASVIEDFDTQPCKKTSKDVHSPVVKTITNYFSPVSKPTEKPFSPPRSNTIMDYFNRKGRSPINSALSPNQSKENCQIGKHSTPPSVTKQPAAKHRRKASKTARKLVETADDTSCIIVEEVDSTDNRTKSAEILGSDTAVLLGQLCTEASVSKASSNHKSIESDRQKRTLLGKSTKRLNSMDLSPILPPKEKSRKGKTSASKKRKQQETAEEDQLHDPELKETEKSLGDISMEVNVGDASQLNNSTVTISFDEFVRSQDGTNNELCQEMESATGNEPLHITDTEDNQMETFLHISPRMVTIQAEVHAISPKEEGKNAGKVASIFNKEKGTSPVQASSPQPEFDLLQVQPPASKWKSNVVLEEDDVELCVLESSSISKCSQADRKQFMAAFKQPGAKNKLVKSQGKQKQSEDKAEDTTDKVCEEDAEIQCIAVQEMDTNASQKKEVKKKPPKKQQKGNIKKDTTATPAAAPEEEAEVIVEIDSKKEDQPKTSPTAPAVRRSRREAMTRQKPKSTMAESPLKQTRKKVSKEDSSASNQKDLVDLSTPKKRKTRHGVFKAEVTCPPDEMESPIRMRFSRVNRDKEGNASTPLVPKNTKESKKTKQAKKLLEKAKARQQNKKVSTEEKMLRRSSRTEVSLKRSYCEDEDSIICVEGPVTQPKSVAEKSKSKTALRSLNDVLGKAASNKEAKAIPGSKVQEKVQDKAPRKPPPVSIFDDGSQDGSENSQDDEQFRARREFLKSGLPESFKKQMAKTASVKEAYTMACAAFQPVMHIYQMPNECPFWSLQWPHSAFLHHLKETGCQVSSLPLAVNERINWKTQPVHRALSERVSSWRPEISAVAREAVMNEISMSNPAFPVQKFMSHFLKKHADLIPQGAASEPSSVSKGDCLELLTEGTGGKRKRTEEEEEMVKAKKQRGTRLAERAPAKKEVRTRRGTKSVSEGPSQATAPVQSGEKSVIVLEDSPLGPKAIEQDVLVEDVLWTDKYQPQHSSEVVGNTSSVRQLYSWLKEWKLRADKEDKKKLKDQKREESNIDSDWECGEEDSRDAEDMLCNTMLITGPSGIGKTAAVYACAQELGFKIFEVNASSQRSGRLILSQLKEATQSHQVDTQGVNAHKPTYFNSYSASSSSSAVRPGSSPGKFGSPRRAVSSPRKLPQSPRTSKRGGLAPTALANFFKMSKPGNKVPKAKEEQTAVSKKKSNEVDSRNTSIKSPPVLSKDSNLEEPSKKTATSLILFEEVDVIFEEDTGFLSAIKTFMTTTKRPVILTTSDPAFSAMFDGNFEEIVFKPPSVLNVASYLQLLCLSENVRMDLKDISSLLSLNHCDIRRTLLQLQFWTRSGGRHTTTLPSGQTEALPQKPEDAVTNMADSEMKDSDTLPTSETRCTESMLGLLNIVPQQNIWELLKRREESWSNLVTMSRQQGVDLLYSNMETLLPLPTTTLAMSNHKPQQHLPTSPEKPVNPPQPHKLPSHARLGHNEEDFSEDTSPVKVSNRMKKNRKKHCPAEKGTLQSDSDSEDEFLSLKWKRAAQVKECASLEPLKVVRKPLSCEERIKSVPVSQCLQSLAEFWDDVSFMDFMSNKETHLNKTCSAAVLKDGLTDEARVDSERRHLQMQALALEIHAQVETLSFNKCSTSLSDAWHNVQQLDEVLRGETTAQLTLPVLSHNERCTFTQNSLCPPHVFQQRTDVMDELCLKGAFGSVGNRPAAAQDYLPTLRTICRSEQLKEQGKVKRRFLHYLDAIHLGLEKSTLEHLAEDFP